MSLAAAVVLEKAVAGRKGAGLESPTGCSIHDDAVIQDQYRGSFRTMHFVIQLDPVDFDLGHTISRIDLIDHPEGQESFLPVSFPVLHKYGFDRRVDFD